MTLIEYIYFQVICNLMIVIPLVSSSLISFSSQYSTSDTLLAESSDLDAP